MIQTSLERGSDVATVIDDGMEVVFQYKIGHIFLQMLMRSDIHLWMIVSSFEDDLVENDTLLMIFFLSLTR